MEAFERTWEGRQFISCCKTPSRGNSFRVLSYFLLADYNKGATVEYSSGRNWNMRKHRMISEISSYDPSIICFQEMDHLHDWWQPQLARRGFSLCTAQRTRFRDNTPIEYVAVAYKTADFQLFKSVTVELNKCVDDLRNCPSNFKQRCRCDDVGLVTLLQPWGTENPLKSALCIATVQLSPRDCDGDIREQQMSYFLKQLEIINSEFQLPVIIGTALHDIPSSNTYHILRTGRMPLYPTAPLKPSRPRIFPICRGSVMVRWFEPPKGCAENPPILRYRISWCPGGSRALGFSANIEVAAEDCILLDNVRDAKGIMRTVIKEELGCNVTGLSSEISYEFKVTAINRLGEGISSDASVPLKLTNPPKDPPMPRPVSLKPLHLVKELSEITGLELEDWNVLTIYNTDVHKAVTKTTPRTIDGLPKFDITRLRSVLPMDINPRSGWRGGHLLGQPNKDLMEELYDSQSLKKSVIRNRSGHFLSSVADHPTGREAEVIDYDTALEAMRNKRERKWSFVDQYRSKILNNLVAADGSLTGRSEHSLVSSVSGASGIRLAYGETTDIAEEVQGRSLLHDNYELSEVMSSAIVPVAVAGKSNIDPTDSDSDFSSDEGNKRQLMALIDKDEHPDDPSTDDVSESSVEEESTISIRNDVIFNLNSFAPVSELDEYQEAMNTDDIVLDIKETIQDIGKLNRRQVHNLGLRSVYEYYCSAGEPIFTKSEPIESFAKVPPRGVVCTDYIFYSSTSIRAVSLLSMPLIHHFSGAGYDPREGRIMFDSHWEIIPPVIANCFDQHMKSLPNFSVAGNNSIWQDLNEFQGHAPKSILSPTGGKSNKDYVSEIKRSLEKSLKTRSTYTIEILEEVGDDKKDDTGSLISPRAGKALKPRAGVWGGSWLPYSTNNPYYSNFWLPNESFASSHIALCADFVLIDENLLSGWQ